MPPTEQFTRETEVAFAEIKGRLAQIEKELMHLDINLNSITDLRVALARLETQSKITWGLLSMVIVGLLSIAFSIWKG